MKRRRYLQYNKLYATPLIAPEDFERNLSSYSDVNIVQEFDNIDNPLKKYIYTVSNDIPRYENSSSIKKELNQHILPSSSGTAIIHEKLVDGTINTDIISLEVSNTTEGRSKYMFTEGSTQRYVCICQEDTSAYIPMDTEWFFFGNATKVQSRSEYYVGFSVSGAYKTTYNTIKYCHTRADIEEIPDDFLFYCTNLVGDFTCPDSIKHIGSRAFAETSINNVSFSRTNKIESIGCRLDNNTNSDYLGKSFYNYTITQPKRKYYLDFPDTFTTIANSYNFSGSNSTQLIFELLRIPPYLEKFSQQSFVWACPSGVYNPNSKDATYCNKLIISGNSTYNQYLYYSTDSYNLLFSAWNEIEIEGVKYSDNNDEQGVSYGTHVKQIENNGKIYNNKYYIGYDRGLHYNDGNEDILLGKPQTVKGTKYCALIDEGTTIIDSSCMRNGSWNALYKDESNTTIRPELVFPKSIKKIYPWSLQKLTNITRSQPFYKFNDDGTDYYDNLEMLNLNNQEMNLGNVFYIPKNVNTINVLRVGSEIVQNTSNGQLKPETHDDWKNAWTKTEINKDNPYLSTYNDVIYSKTINNNYHTLIQIPKCKTGSVAIHSQCRHITQYSCQSLYGITDLIFEDWLSNDTDTSNKIINFPDYTFYYCRNLSNIQLKSNSTIGFRTFGYAKPGSNMIFPKNFSSYNNGNHMMYTNTFSNFYGDSDETLSWFVKNNMLFHKRNGYIYFVAIPEVYTDSLMEIPEGVYGLGFTHRGTNGGQQYYFYDYNKDNSLVNIYGNINLILPTTIEKITNIGYNATTYCKCYHPEIHIHSNKYPTIYDNRQDTELREGNNVTYRKYRICRVPVDATGYDGVDASEESYINNGCWCNPINWTVKQISELRFDLVQLYGEIENYNGQKEFTLTQVGDEKSIFDENILSNTNDNLNYPYYYDHLKEVIVPINEDGTYEVWVKNVKYQVNDTNTYIEPLVEQTKKTINNSKGKTIDIVTVNFGDSIPTHKKRQDIIL